MKNFKIQHYIILFILMISSTTMFSQFGGGEDGGGGDNCAIYSYRDADGDGWGVYSQKICDTHVPNGYSIDYGDKDDTNPLITNITPRHFYKDGDGDGYGNRNISAYRSVRPSGYVTNDDDHDDTTGLITNIAPRYFYRDYDTDSFGNPNSRVYRSVKPAGYVTNASDCHDGNININPNTIWYLDGDNDGYAHSTKKQCTRPSSKYKLSVTGMGDCHDGDASLNPQTLWYKDGDGDTFGDKSNLNNTIRQCSQPTGYVRNNDDHHDDNPYITNIPPKYFYRDADSDTYGNPAIKYYRSFPPSDDGYEYVLNDDDKDDTEALITNIQPQNFYRDSDNDTFGDPLVAFYYSAAPTDGYNYVLNANDQDDTDALITNLPLQYFYLDFDTDTFGTPNTRVYKSIAPAGYVDNANDCDDGNIDINPLTTWYKDGDGDGRGDSYDLSTIKIQCSQPEGYVLNHDDINDENEWITNITPRNFYRDWDEDGFGDPNIVVPASIPPTINGHAYVDNNDDLQDSNEWITNITPKTFYRDGDTDTFGDPSKQFYRSAPPQDGYSYVLNGSDKDDTTANITNIEPKDFYRDKDEDTFGNPNIKFHYSAAPTDGYIYVLNGNDCDDDIKEINPNTVWYNDSDGDTWGNPNDTKTQCEQPTGYITRAGDKCPEEFGENEGCLFSNENFVFTRIYQTPTMSPQSTDVIESITYFDGLGRSKQQRAIKASPNQKDIVTHITYDNLGRQTKDYLPFESNQAGGNYTTVNITNDINTYYKNTYADDFTGVATADINAYAEKVYEDSPLGRVLKQGAAGTAWKADHNSDADHTIKFDWGFNQANEVVYFEVEFENGNTEAPKLVKNGNYVENQLYVTITKDENWTVADGNNHTTKEYTNKQGQVVLKRTFASTNSASSEAHDTYYVYDDFGNLTYVIPPKVTVNDGVSATELAELCYQYTYDYRNRLVEKKIPGKDWEYIVYDILDRPVFTQHGNQRGVNTGKTYNCWDVTRYDALGRIAYTGVMINNVNRKLLQSRTTNANDPLYETKQGTEVNIAGTMVHYSRNTYLSSSMTKVYTVNYYDTYSFDKGLLSTPTTVLGQAVTTNTKSLPTGTKVRVLGTDDWITTVTYYDAKGRPIYIASENEYLHTTDIIETELDFTGRVLQTKTSHTKGSNAAIVTIDTFEYDHMGRVTKQTQKINSQDEELIAGNSYDALGQLIAKNVGGGLQNVDYTYNVRGWLKGINDVDNLGSDLFGFKIGYDQGGNALYNGNINRTEWKTQNDNKKRFYNYYYDELNRILRAGYNTELSDEPGWFNVTNISYDKNGNLLTLNRAKKGSPSAGAAMDYLTYSYDAGNKLVQVEDQWTNAGGFEDGSNTGNDYEYDVNGNMTNDHNKGISSITYNHLNLPETVSISNSEGTGTIAYIYDATGAKLKKIVTEGSSITNTEYASGYVYKNNQLQYLSTPEGYATPNGSFYRYVYQFKDHLDNVRLSFAENDAGNLEIVKENNYYPFGLKQKGYNSAVSSLGNSTAQLLGFGGKEEQDELGIGWIDITARNYDPSLGRWFVIDALADQPEQIFRSPYQYGWNNPIYYNDPDGNCPQCWDWIKQTANEIVLGGIQGSNNFIKNTHEGFKNMALMNNARMSAVLNGDFKTAANINGAQLEGAVAGVVQPVVLYAQAANDISEGNVYGATAKVAEANGSIAVAALTEGTGRALNTTRRIVNTTDNISSNLIKAVDNTPQVGVEFGSLGAKIVDGNISLSGRSVTTGSFDFVVNKAGDLVVGNGHHALSGGKAVQAAGTLKIYKGKVTTITNSSGHYKPSVSAGEGFGNILKNAGVDVSGTKLKLYNQDGVLQSTTKL